MQNFSTARTEIWILRTIIFRHLDKVLKYWVRPSKEFLVQPPTSPAPPLSSTHHLLITSFPLTGGPHNLLLVSWSVPWRLTWADNPSIRLVACMARKPCPTCPNDLAQRSRGDTMTLILYICFWGVLGDKILSRKIPEYLVYCTFWSSIASEI